MAIRIHRNNDEQSANHHLISPAVSNAGHVYFSWTTGGIERQSSWSLSIEPGNFEGVIKAMLATDRTATIEAFASALKSET